MLKIYRVKKYVSIDNGEWKKIEKFGCNTYIMSNDSSSEKIIFKNKSFDECFEFLGNHYINGLSRSESIFRHKPLINVCYSCDFTETSYKSFNTISCKETYTEIDITFDDMMKTFSAEQTIEYIKERGLNVCPVLNK